MATDRATKNRRNSSAIAKESLALVAVGFLAMAAGAWVVPAAAEEVRVIRSGNVTEIESNKQGTIGTAVKTGPITTYEFKGGTKVQSVQMGNVTQYRANDGAKATAVDTGPVRTVETDAGKNSMVRIGAVTVSTEPQGPQSVSLQNNVAVKTADGAVATGEQGVQAAALIEGSARTVTQKRELPEFSALVVNGIVDVTAAVGHQAGVTVTGDPDVVQLLETVVSRDTLRIRLQKTARSSPPPRILLTMPGLSRIQSSGGGHIVVTGIQGAVFGVKSRGTADILLSGKTDMLDAEVDGTGALDARALEATDAEVVMNGTAAVHVTVHRRLSAQINGDGDVVCHGRPQEIRKTVEGVGDCVIVEPK